MPDRAVDERGAFRPYHARQRRKSVYFYSGEDLQLARLIEAKRQLEKVHLNDLLLRLLRQGLDAEVGRKP